MLKYHPYPANDGKHKYYIITNSGKIIKFGAIGYSDLQNTRMKQGNKDI